MARRRMQKYTNWTEQETDFLVKNLQVLGVDGVAEALQRSRMVISKKAIALGLKIHKKPDHDWYLRMPFQVTEGFISGWKVVYGDYPMCADCGVDVHLGDFARWVGQRDAKRLVCGRCEADDQIRGTGS